MKNNIGLQFLVLVCFFFGTFFILKQVNWVEIFKIEKVSKATEKKLGDLYWQFVKSTAHEVKSESVKDPVQKLVTKILTSNGMDESSVKLHIVDKEEVNAFALPNGHLVVLTGLINNCKNESELSGVIGHEIAHIQRDHVMKKLVKELGLNVLISMTSGSAGEVVKNTVKMLSSAAYDRALEEEADLTSVDYMIEANIDPKPFADFLGRMSKAEKNMPDQFFWMSTHPESEKRSKDILEAVGEKEYSVHAILGDSTWSQLKKKVKSY